MGSSLPRPQYVNQSVPYAIKLYVSLSIRLIHLFRLHLFYQLYAALVQLLVFNHIKICQGQQSAVDIAACEALVAAVDARTVLTRATVFLIKPSIYTDLSELISIDFTGRYTTMRCPSLWHLDSNYCRTRCRKSRLRLVLSPLLSPLHLLGWMLFPILVWHSSTASR